MRFSLLIIAQGATGNEFEAGRITDPELARYAADIAVQKAESDAFFLRSIDESAADAALHTANSLRMLIADADRQPF